MKTLLRSSFFRPLTTQLRCSEKLISFTDFYHKKIAEDQNKKVSTGRAWKVEELRLKSSEDLQKLWYVMLKEKNMINSDNQLKKKIHGTKGPQGRMSKVRVSMARILTVINERKKICELYREKLEEEYVQAQRELYKRKLEEEAAKPSVVVPEISTNLLRAKNRDLRAGIDNTDYIREAVEIAAKRASLKMELNEKYDYRDKVLLKPGEEAPDVPEEKIVRRFASGVEEQLKSGQMKLTQEEVLRSHVKNWRMLDLRQRRKVLGTLNAQRSRDAKAEFLKELNILGQKLAYDSMQKRLSSQSQSTTS